MDTVDNVDNRSRTLARFLIASTIALSIPLAADARPTIEGHGGAPLLPGEPAGLGTIPFLHDLNLSEAQQDRIIGILHAQAPQMRDNAEAARKARHELQEMSLSDKFNESKARTLADSAARAEAELALLRVRGTRQVLALLSPEQRKQAADLQQRFDANRAGDDGPHGARGPDDARGPRPPQGLPGGRGAMHDRGEF